MEVILKKTKLTSSILNQMLFANIEQLLTYQILGWVNHSKFLKIILYDQETNNLRYVFLNSGYVIIDGHNIRCINPGRYSNDTWILLSEEEAQEKLIVLNSLKDIAKEKGQIFF